MSTSCMIGLMDFDGKTIKKSTRINFDGYPDGALKTLNKYWTQSKMKYEKIEHELFDYGEIRSLGKSFGKSIIRSFGKSYDKNEYYIDLGESKKEFPSFDNILDFKNYAQVENSEEFSYVYVPGIHSWL